MQGGSDLTECLYGWIYPQLLLVIIIAAAAAMGDAGLKPTVRPEADPDEDPQAAPSGHENQDQDAVDCAGAEDRRDSASGGPHVA